MYSDPNKVILVLIFSAYQNGSEYIFPVPAGPNKMNFAVDRFPSSMEMISKPILLLNSTLTRLTQALSVAQRNKLVANFLV